MTARRIAPEAAAGDNNEPFYPAAQCWQRVTPRRYSQKMPVML